MLAIRRLLLPLLFYCGLRLDATIGGQAADPKRDYELVFENFTCAAATMMATSSSLATRPHSSSTASLKQKTAKQSKTPTATEVAAATSVIASRELWYQQQQQQQRQKKLQKQLQQQQQASTTKQKKNSQPPQLVQRLSCGLNKNSKRRTLQMEMSFGRQLEHFDFNLLIILPRKHSNNDDDFVLLNLTRIDGCQFLANRNQVTLLQLGRANLNHYSNYPHDCPLLAETVYYVRNYRWSMDTLPAFAIETDIHITFDYVVDGLKIITGYIKARLDLKSSKKELAQVIQF